tara:strand:- start:1135 stop:1386 length:252 start_codon:yes stop_codon:yes gene_type:complete
MAEKKTKEELIQEAITAKLEDIAARKEVEIKAGFLNPYGEGTSYKEFKAALKKANNATVKEYCKGKLTEDQLTFLEKELSILK